MLHRGRADSKGTRARVAASVTAPWQRTAIEPRSEIVPGVRGQLQAKPGSELLPQPGDGRIVEAAEDQDHLIKRRMPDAYPRRPPLADTARWVRPGERGESRANAMKKDAANR